MFARKNIHWFLQQEFAMETRKNAPYLTSNYNTLEDMIEDL